MAEDVLKYMKKYGKTDHPKAYRVVCQRCGKVIRSEDIASGEIGYTITRRGTAAFWHITCKGRVFSNKILWRTDNGQN